MHWSAGDWPTTVSKTSLTLVDVEMPILLIVKKSCPTLATQLWRRLTLPLRMLRKTLSAWIQDGKAGQDMETMTRRFAVPLSSWINTSNLSSQPRMTSSATSPNPWMKSLRNPTTTAPALHSSPSSSQSWLHSLLVEVSSCSPRNKSCLRRTKSSSSTKREDLISWADNPTSSSLKPSWSDLINDLRFTTVDP